MEQHKKNKVSLDEIKVFANFISKKCDIPVSVQVDGQLISLALFWDTRVLGSMKMLDYQTFQDCKTLEMDQFVEVTLETAFDFENLFTPNETGISRTVPHLLLDGFVFNLRS
jgi:hypothetical protein